jgi:2-polyprenyl-3-methyl-5-hydroxy-6-metoxy-1,4-benzoquinol methylase
VRTARNARDGIYCFRSGVVRAHLLANVFHVGNPLVDEWGSLMSHTETANYYQADRPEMLELLPAATGRLLELGCGEGAFSAAAKRRFGAECWAMEYNHAVATKASAVLDRVLVGDADQHIDELPDDYFDAIVCNDVLEHLANPQDTLMRLRPKLRTGGVVVASIPNIRYLPALSRIIFGRDFPLEDDGTFDRTHLRWFTRKSIRRMFDAAGYQVQSMRGHNMGNPLAVAVGIFSLGFFWDGVWMQYKCVATPQ